MSEQAENADSPHIKFVALIAGEQNFCISIKQILEIRRWVPVTILPHSPDYVLGVINMRGAVIPILDLAAKLGFGLIEPTLRHVIIITIIGDRTVGLLVESVSEILTVREDQMRETPRLREDETTRCILGVIAIQDDMTRVIDLNAIMPRNRSEAA